MAASKALKFANSLKELRLHLCQKSPSSKGARLELLFIINVQIYNYFALLLNFATTSWPWPLVKCGCGIVPVKCGRCCVLSVLIKKFRHRHLSMSELIWSCDSKSSRHWNTRLRGDMIEVFKIAVDIVTTNRAVGFIWRDDVSVYAITHFPRGYCIVTILPLVPPGGVLESCFKQKWLPI